MVQFLSQYRKVDLIEHLLPYFFVSVQVNWDWNNNNTFISIHIHVFFFLLVILVDTLMQSFYFELWSWCKHDASVDVLEHVPCRPVHEPHEYDSLAERVSPRVRTSTNSDRLTSQRLEPSRHRYSYLALPWH